mmetsp:Transcript_22003/g.39946  ORF Transcript_22003/g.39946 Transcript_22003/m.39946 type:complete len:476 (+) Transcript_22003:64-1491(+)
MPPSHSRVEHRRLQADRPIGELNPLHALAIILLSFNPAAMFNPAISGVGIRASTLAARYQSGRYPPSASMGEELSQGDKLQLKAEKLKLQAEKAALEVELLELEAAGVKPIASSGSSAPDSSADEEAPATEDAVEPMQVSSNLKFLGPYPCLALRFPKLGTAGQRKRGEAGVTFEFVLDTAANSNTLNAGVAKELALEAIGRAPGGTAAGGAITGGDTYMLGECQLWERLGLEEGGENPTFMSGLTASALPVAAPTAAGILGVYFFNAFPGGVEFFWGDNASLASPAVSFYGDKAGMEQVIAQKKLVDKAEVRVLPSGLPSVKLVVNGAEIPALLDTGSPITVLNSPAAALAKLQTVDLSVEKDSDSGGFNPFAKLAQGFKSTQARGQAMANGDLLMIAGTQGEPVELLRTTEAAKISVDTAAFADSKVFVGNLPGLQALNGLGGEFVPPAAVLGMDVLRLRPRMLYRSNEVYFS